MSKINYKYIDEVGRPKARLITKGYNQKKRIDYQEKFSPIVKMVSISYILVIASIRHWDIYQIDVYNVFLNGDFHDEIYVDISQGLIN